MVLLVPGHVAADGPTPVATIPSAKARSDARAYAAQRQGEIGWAVVDTAGRMHGRGLHRVFRSASVTKAMLLVAELHRFRGRPVPAAIRRVLTPMIRRSSNRAAHRIRDVVGDAGLWRVARLARMRNLQLNGTWSEVGITAADQARLFLRIDRLVPPRHRPYARSLLRTIVIKQSWGIPAPARRRGFEVFFKGGWRSNSLVHQAALLERDGRRLSIAVLTTSPTHDDGRATIEGITRRLLGPPPQ